MWDLTPTCSLIIIKRSVCAHVYFQVFYPTLNINGKLFVAMDQNGVSPPPVQGQLPACTMEKVKEESVSMVPCVCVCAGVETMVEPSNTQTCELSISALNNFTVISRAKDAHVGLFIDVSA